MIRISGGDVVMTIDFRVQLPRPTRAKTRPDFMKQYTKIFDLDSVSYTVDSLLEGLKKAGITKAVMQSEWTAGDYRADNDAVAKLVREYPNLFVGFGAVDMADGLKAADEVKRCYEELGLKGINIQPFASGIHINDKKSYLIYKQCHDYSIPITIHTGINYSSTKRMELGRPIYVDEVACDFPDLTVVLNHGGWPWVGESVAMARKYPNVYIEFGGISPKYIAKPGAGWEMLLTLADNLLREKILFATDSMLPFERAVTEAEALPLKPESIEAIMHKNAESILSKLK